MSLLKKVMAKNSDLGITKDYIDYYRTGIDLFDYMNGLVSSSGELLLGVAAGRAIQIIGNSGCGKSTITMQFADNIRKPFLNVGAPVVHYDYERASSKERIMNLTGMTVEQYEETYSLLNSQIHTESFFNMCVELKRAKLGLDPKDPKKIDKEAAAMYSYTKNGHELVIPTPIIIDSVASMMPKEYAEDTEREAGTNMLGAQTAKINGVLLKKLLPIIEEANIIPIMINHITTEVSTSITPTRAQFPFLKQGEKVSGGKAVHYLTNTLIKLETTGKLSADKEYGISGYIVTGTLIKSRSNAAGVPFEMIFIQETGYDNFWTNYHNLKKMGLIGGAGRSFKLSTYPEVTFAQKDAKDKYNTIPAFKEAFDIAVKEAYTKMTLDLDKIKPDDLYVAVEGETNLFMKDGLYYELKDGSYVEVEVEVV